MPYLWHVYVDKIILNSPEAAKSLDLLASMVKEDLVVPGAPTLKDEDSNTLFFNNKLVVEMTTGMWNVTQVEQQIKDGKIQGKGWELKEYSKILENFTMFKNIYEIYTLENPDFKPMTELLPTSVKISQYIYA